MKFQTFFALGMKRSLPDLPELDTLPVLNLGAGNVASNGWWTEALDYPEWDASLGIIPRDSDSIGAVLAFHFLEHLNGREAIAILREIERVLVPGGSAFIVVPHRLSQMAYHDLDHKSFWTEETWKTLFSTPYYDKNREVPWRLAIEFNLIAGIVERNLALFTVLRKV